MRIESSNKQLVEYFDWALAKAKEFIMTDKTGEINKGEFGYYYGPAKFMSNRCQKTRKNNKEWSKCNDYIPCYWAGYKARTAFYSRDFLHMCSGAHYMGFDKENLSMMLSFINMAVTRKEMFAPWSLNFDGSLYYLDHKNEKIFAQEYTVQFEFVEMLYKLFLLTKDQKYVRSGNVLKFCKYVMNDFIDNNDTDANGIPEGRGNMWKGSPTYNETSVDYRETADCIAALYRARLAYSEILRINGLLEQADSEYLKAQKLKIYYEDTWSRDGDKSQYVFGIDKRGKRYCDWSKSNSKLLGGETLFFIAYKKLVYANARTDEFLNYLYNKVTDPISKMNNIESFTYLPLTFCNYSKADYAWNIIKTIGNSRYDTYSVMKDYRNEDYPELCFTMISNIIEGLIGVNYDTNGIINVVPCLPQEISDVALYDMPYNDAYADIIITNGAAKISFHNQCNSQTN